MHASCVALTCGEAHRRQPVEEDSEHPRLDAAVALSHQRAAAPAGELDIQLRVNQAMSRRRRHQLPSRGMGREPKLGGR